MKPENLGELTLGDFELLGELAQDAIDEVDLRPRRKLVPQVQKQSNTRPKKSGSVLDRISPVSESEVGIRMTIYGQTKTGKTRLACTFPKPLLLIGAEDGTKSVSNVKGVDFVRLQASKEVKDLIDGAITDGKYKTVVLDTATSLYDIVVKEILNLAELPLSRSWGMAKRDQWTQAANIMKERLWSLLHVSEVQGTSILILAQEKNANEESEGQSSELLTPNIGASVSKSVRGLLDMTCDYICQTFIREQTVEEVIKGTSTVMSKLTGKKEYCLRVGAHALYKTGFRLPPGGDGLPEAIINPTWTQIEKLIQGG
jgi:hypothetical protein